ncbi:MAG: hypothetical protein N3F66_08255 [Spirochaetes bacterium]|nr:hypothetical protein [Spirochaetota bacterium]
MDELILYLIREYHTAVMHTLTISTIIAVWVVLCGCIRFGIAVYRRAKGIYPPAESLREGH